MSNSTEITKVQVIIRRFLWETREVVKDGESSRRWLESFRNTLQFQDLNENPEPYALALLSESRKFNDLQLYKQQIRWVRESLKKEGNANPTKEQIEARWNELYGEADTREGSDESHNAGDCGAWKATTFSENMRRVPQNEAPAHGFSGGRTAHGTMSPEPSGAAQDGKFRGSAKTQGESNTGSTVPAVRPESGNIYDQETSQTSTNEARESQRRAGADSVRGTPLHSAPARSSGAMPDDAQLVYDFAAAENLDPVDAYECWNVTVNERDGKTADGKKVTNWKAYVRKWCVTRASNRRTA